MNSPTHLVTALGIRIPLSEIDLDATRSRGPGGQHVNKTASAVRLSFDIAASPTLSDDQRQRLLAASDGRLTADGRIVIRAESSRLQSRNRTEALDRLAQFIDEALEVRRPRRKTRPPRKSMEQRLKDKAHRGRLKASRRPPDE